MTCISVVVKCKAYSHLFLHCSRICRFRYFDGSAQFCSNITSVDFCRLLISFANRLDPNQFDILTVFLEEFFEKVYFENSHRRQQNHEKLPSMRRVKVIKRAVHDN